MKYLLLMPLALLATACAGKPTRLIESEWVSMTRTNVPQLKDLSEVGPVDGKYCYSSFKSGHVGLMDEAISQAQKKHNVDYIRNATFMMDRRDICVSVEGVGYRTKKM